MIGFPQDFMIYRDRHAVIPQRLRGHVNMAKPAASRDNRFHKCHLKIKVGTRTEDRVAAVAINFNLIFSSEPTDSRP